MNINRQAGRRRGRGGQRQGGNPNGGNNGNRIDNRARGNANQLYEKYKGLAAEAQRQGDRVNTEYYLQFADHYFRVLAENRSRFEDQNQPRRNRDDVFDDEDEGFEEEGAATEVAEQPRRERDRYRDREDRGNRLNGHEAEPATETADVVESVEAEPAPQERPRRGRPRRERAPEPAVEASEGEAIDAGRLPPSLGFAIGNEGEEVAPKPRRRTRRTAANETTEAADAAE